MRRPDWPTIRSAALLDRTPALLVAAALAVYVLIAASEVAITDHDGMTTSLVGYLPLVVGIVWVAPAVARELESGTAVWAWSMGADRGRWLLTRTAPMVGGAIASSLLLGLLVLASQARWFPAMTQDRITPMLVSASVPAIVAFCLLAVAVGLYAAVLTRRLVPSIGLTTVAILAVLYAVPEIAVRLAPSRSTTATVTSGRIVSQHVDGAVTITRYVPDSSYWSVTLAMSAAVALLALVLAVAAARRLRSLAL